MNALLNREEYGGWKRRINSGTYYHLWKIGLPGWTLSRHGGSLRVYCAFIVGKGPQSLDVIREFDEVCKGQFAVSDHSSSGTPFVTDGEIYVTCFDFQLQEDYVLFCRKYADHTQFGGGKNLLVEYDDYRREQHEKYIREIKYVPFFEPSDVISSQMSVRNN